MRSVSLLLYSYQGRPAQYRVILQYINGFFLWRTSAAAALSGITWQLWLVCCLLSDEGAQHINIKCAEVFQDNAESARTYCSQKNLF